MDTLGNRTKAPQKPCDKDWGMAADSKVFEPKNNI